MRVAGVYPRRFFCRAAPASWNVAAKWLAGLFDPSHPVGIGLNCRSLRWRMVALLFGSGGDSGCRRGRPPGRRYSAVPGAIIGSIRRARPVLRVAVATELTVLADEPGPSSAAPLSRGRAHLRPGLGALAWDLSLHDVDAQLGVD